MEKQSFFFEFFHYAGNTFEDAINVIIDGRVPLSVLFNAILSAVQAYNLSDRFDLALKVIENAQGHFFDNETNWVSPSPIMKKQYHEVLVYQAQLLIMNFEFDDCLTFSKRNFDENDFSLFEAMVDASKIYSIYGIDYVIEQCKNSKKFNLDQIHLYERHLHLISLAVESGIHQLFVKVDK